MLRVSMEVVLQMHGGGVVSGGGVANGGGVVSGGTKIIYTVTTVTLLRMY